MANWPLSIQEQAGDIKSACQQYGVPINVFMGMYHNETSLGTNVSASSAGAIGPFQFIPSTAASYNYPLTNTPNSQEFAQQAAAAAHLLSDNFKAHGTWALALAYYLGDGNPNSSYVQSALAFQVPADWAAALGSATGGTAGLGGTGTGANAPPKVAFTVGDVSNPHEDYWTAINRLSQDRYWYLFSDAETLYLADGTHLMKQDPVTTVAFGDERVNHIEWLWDNTAFNYASDHKRHGSIQRKSHIAKVSSPVEVQLQLICQIDEFRAGDVITFQGFGAGDGKWLIGDAKRSVFSVMSELTLVPAVAPLTEDQVAGASNKNTNQASGGRSTGGGGAGPVFPLKKGTYVGQSSWSQDQGVDIATNGSQCGSSAPLYAMFSGTVSANGIGGFGPWAPTIKLDAPYKQYTHIYYGHAGPDGLAKPGTHVNAGDQVASVGCGSVGISTGPHLEIGFASGDTGSPVGSGSSGDMLSLLKSARVQ